MKSDLVETGIVVEDGKNPISKMPVLVSGDQGMVYIDEIPIGAPIDIAAQLVEMRSQRQEEMM